MTDRLETLRPDPTWDATEHEAALERIRNVRAELTIRVWGGDWCIDCQETLPLVGAALSAAGVSLADVHQYSVEKDDEGRKHGELVEAYEIEFIPTVVFERDGKEIVRFVESAERDPVEVLAEGLPPVAVEN